MARSKMKKRTSGGERSKRRAASRQRPPGTDSGTSSEGSDDAIGVDVSRLRNKNSAGRGARTGSDSSEEVEVKKGRSRCASKRLKPKTRPATPELESEQASEASEDAIGVDFKRRGKQQAANRRRRGRESEKEEITHSQDGTGADWLDSQSVTDPLLSC